MNCVLFSEFFIKKFGEFHHLAFAATPRRALPSLPNSTTRLISSSSFGHQKLSAAFRARALLFLGFFKRLAFPDGGPLFNCLALALGHLHCSFFP